MRGEEAVKRRDDGRDRQTTYRGPTRVAELTFGDVTVRLLRPCDPDLLLDDPLVTDWNQHDDYMPYWAYLWPAAYILADRVAREPKLKQQRAQSDDAGVLEIGCGLGLAGLVAVACGLHVQFTDYDEAPLDFVAQAPRRTSSSRRAFQHAGSTGVRCPTRSFRSFWALMSFTRLA